MSALITVLVSLLGTLDQHHIARVTLDQGRDLRVVAAADKITFPVTGYGSILDFGWSLTDRDGVADPAMVLGLLCVMA